MKLNFIIENYGRVKFENGVPSTLSQYLLPEAKAFHAIDHWGTICIQEIETEKYLLRHYLFVFEKTISCTITKAGKDYSPF